MSPQTKKHDFSEILDLPQEFLEVQPGMDINFSESLENCMVKDS